MQPLHNLSQSQNSGELEFDSERYRTFQNQIPSLLKAMPGKRNGKCIGTSETATTRRVGSLNP